MATTSTVSIWLMMMLASSACSSSSAFTLSSSSGGWPTTTAMTTHRPSLLISSPVVLSAKPKTKSAKNKQQHTRGSGGGGGFVSTTRENTQEQQESVNNARAKASHQSSSSSSRMSPQPQRRLLSAIEAARKNTAVCAQQQQKDIEQKESTKNVGDAAASDTTDPTMALRGRRLQKWSQRHAAVDFAAELAERKSRFTEEYLQEQAQEQEQQQDREPSSKVGQLVQLSQNPLLFTIDGFVDPAACRQIQNDGAGCFHLFYPEKLSLLFNGQENEMDGLLFTIASSKDHPTTDPYPHGLHMDTNNQCLFRHVTCILYLNDIPEECGGATVFPLARCLPNDPALAASRRLLAHKLSHTRNHAALQDWGLVADAALIESRVGTNYLQRPATDTAIRIQPQAGRLLIFFSRDSQGHEDPRAWHGGERIRPPPCASSDITSDDGTAAATIMEKRILTLFKEVDYDYYSSSSSSSNADELEDESTRFQKVASTLESFLAPQCQAQRHWLQAKASYN